MEPVRFDTLTRTLSSTGTRRGALGALLAGALGVLGLAETEAARKKPRRQQARGRQQQRDQNDATSAAKKRRKASAEGPCGNGSAKANACKRDGQCCTGNCDKKKGRCRCKKLGQGCTADRNCCATFGQPMTCQSGACTRVLPAPPQPFCAGKDQCFSEDDVSCEISGDTCFCWVRADAGHVGEPFCGGVASALGPDETCSDCDTDEVCVDRSGPECADEPALGCALPCANPRQPV